ncbi:host cell division inhibitor Icd-like protein [Rahnella inusitata]|uniref:host cell division inhibitor Icd-like protein n=1 Tax=Rahnella inusitata TaxID=58169 RepID=UPI003083F423
MKEPDVSSNSLTSSISSITSWGMRIEICFDLLFIVFEAITKPLLFKCDSLYMEKNHIKGLTCDSLEFKLNHTFDLLLSTNDNALQCSNTKRAPIHNVTETYTMALQHSTQTRPEKKYLWRFLALNRSDMSAKPCRISVEALTEHDARRVLAPFHILSLSARLSAQGVCNV